MLILTTRSVDDISQLGVLPLAEVVLFHAGGGLGCLHLRAPGAKREVEKVSGWEMSESELTVMLFMKLLHELSLGSQVHIQKS